MENFKLPRCFSTVNNLLTLLTVKLVLRVRIGAHSLIPGQSVEVKTGESHFSYKHSLKNGFKLSLWRGLLTFSTG